MSETKRTIGSLARLACTWEVLARKAGNVCPGREFPDLTVNDFLVSAAAIAPVLDEAPRHPLGVTILRCIEETRKVVNTNTNLGIVLLLAPLASVPLDVPLMHGLEHVLSRTTVEDARKVYAAIRLAKPGGLGQVKEQDVHEEPTLPLRDVMALAVKRDLIAREYTTRYSTTVAFAHQLVSPEGQGNVEQAIVLVHLIALFLCGDSLIARKLGDDAVQHVQEEAQKVLEQFVAGKGHREFLAFDAWLRADNHARNPGTTADLMAAALFVALRERLIDPNTPFHWHGHPFELSA